MRNFRNHFLAIVSIALIAPSAFANDDEIKCRKDGNTLEMNVCSSEDYKKADKELNNAYSNAVKFAKDADKDIPKKDAHNEQYLRAAQNQWIKFRDAECKSQSEIYSGGSIQNMIHLTCLKDATAARTIQLFNYSATY